MFTINPILWMRTLRLRKSIEFALSYAASKLQGQNLELGLSELKIHSLPSGFLNLFLTL